MNFKNHSLAGSATGLIVGGATYYMTRNPETAIAFAGITLAGSLAPDLDCHSTTSRITSFLGAILCGFLIYSKNYEIAAWAGFIFFVIKSQKHRGPTHSYFLPVICYVLAYWLGKWYALPFGIGIMVHYILDSMNIFSLRNWVGV